MALYPYRYSMNWKDIYDDFKYKNPLVAIVHRPTKTIRRCNGYDLTIHLA